mgnify:CR=1 FL=1
MSQRSTGSCPRANAFPEEDLTKITDAKHPDLKPPVVLWLNNKGPAVDALPCNLFVTSKKETTNSQIHKFNVLQKVQ